MNGEQMMAQFEEANIDPVKYGQLWEKVQNYERRFDDMEKKIDKLEAGMEELLALANKSRGGLFTGMMIVSAISAVIGYITSHFLK